MVSNTWTIDDYVSEFYYNDKMVLIPFCPIEYARNIKYVNEGLFEGRKIKANSLVTQQVTLTAKNVYSKSHEGLNLLLIQ